MIHEFDKRDRVAARECYDSYKSATMRTVLDRIFVFAPSTAAIGHYTGVVFTTEAQY